MGPRDTSEGWSRRRQRRHEAKEGITERVKTREGFDPQQLALKKQEGGHERRNACSL